MFCKAVFLTIVFAAHVLPLHIPGYEKVFSQQNIIVNVQSEKFRNFDLRRRKLLPMILTIH